MRIKSIFQSARMVLVLALILTMAAITSISSTPANAKPNNAQIRDIQEVVAAQGTFCIPHGMGRCFLFVPPGMGLPRSCVAGEDAYGSESYDRAIEDMNRCIATRGALLTTENLAIVYQLRGLAYSKTRNYNRAIQDLNESIRLDPNLGFSFYNRGVAYHEMGQYERAIQDYNKAVALEPNEGVPLIGRGNSYLDMGEVDRAFRDFDDAIRLKPGYVKARGNAYFLLGRFGEAVQDYHRIYSPDPYTALWLYIAQVRSGPDAGNRHVRDNLARNTANLNMSKWPAPVVSMFLEETSPEQVLAAARDSDRWKQQVQRCDAYFFIGQWHLMRGDATRAAQFFQEAVATEAINRLAYDFAKAELGRKGA
jgi:lipoprotein NlpI